MAQIKTTIEDEIFDKGERFQNGTEEEKIESLISSKQFHLSKLNERVEFLKPVVTEYKKTGRMPDFPLGGLVDDLRFTGRNYMGDIAKLLLTCYNKVVKQTKEEIKKNEKALKELKDKK